METRLRDRTHTETTGSGQTDPGGRSWLVPLSLAGLVASLIAVVIGLIFIENAASSFRSSLAVTGRAVSLAQDSVEVVADSLTVASGSFEQVQSSVATSVGTFQQIDGALTQAGVIVGDDVPEALSAVREVTPVLVNAADTVATSLAALSILGVDIEEPVPVQTLRDLDRQLADLSDRLENEGSLLTTLAGDFGQFSTDADAIGESIGAAADSLATAEDIVDSYRTTSGDAAEVLADAAEDVDRQVWLARALVIALGLVLGLSQVGLLLVSRRFNQLES